MKYNHLDKIGPNMDGIQNKYTEFQNLNSLIKFFMIKETTFIKYVVIRFTFLNI
jgi:hypothetical protein